MSEAPPHTDGPGQNFVTWYLEADAPSAETYRVVRQRAYFCADEHLVLFDTACFATGLGWEAAGAELYRRLRDPGPPTVG